MTYFLNTKLRVMLSAAAVVAAAFLLVASTLTSVVHASRIIGISTNIADVPGGASFVLTVTAQNDGDVYELEVDHSLDDTHPGIIPEFSVYADEADPYGGDGALFAAVGASVTYSAANSQWVIDFGQDLTDDIVATGGDMKFYLALLDDNRNYLWGGMSPVSPENTFSYNLVTGTGDSLVPEINDEDEEVIVPGVPNTSVVR